MWSCENVRFLTSESCVTVSNPDLFPSSETRVYTDQSWMKKLNKRLLEWAKCQKAFGGIYFTRNKCQAETLLLHLLAEWLVFFFFWVPWSGFLKEGIKTCWQIASTAWPTSPLQSPLSPIVFLSWHLQSMAPSPANSQLRFCRYAEAVGHVSFLQTDLYFADLKLYFIVLLPNCKMVIHEIMLQFASILWLEKAICWSPDQARAGTSSSKSQRDGVLPHDGKIAISSSFQIAK